MHAILGASENFPRSEHTNGAMQGEVRGSRGRLATQRRVIAAKFIGRNEYRFVSDFTSYFSTVRCEVLWQRARSWAIGGGEVIAGKKVRRFRWEIAAQREFRQICSKISFGFVMRGRMVVALAGSGKTVWKFGVDRKYLVICAIARALRSSRRA